MTEYHKIQTVFKRDPENRNKTLLEGQYSLSEFEYLAGNEWVFTEKVDGTNIRVMFGAMGEVTFGGKTDKAQIPSDLVNRLNERVAFWTPEARDKHEGLVLYGEGYGPKIQKGGKYRDDQAFVLFDVFGTASELWLKREDVVNIAANLGFDVVPIIKQGPLSWAVEMCREGFKSEWGDFTAEGIVARPKTELLTRRGHRVITKIKHRDFTRGVTK